MSIIKIPLLGGIYDNAHKDRKTRCLADFTRTDETLYDIAMSTFLGEIIGQILIIESSNDIAVKLAPVSNNINHFLNSIKEQNTNK